MKEQLRGLPIRYKYPSGPPFELILIYYTANYSKPSANSQQTSPMTICQCDLGTADPYREPVLNCANLSCQQLSGGTSDPADSNQATTTTGNETSVQSTDVSGGAVGPKPKINLTEALEALEALEARTCRSAGSLSLHRWVGEVGPWNALAAAACDEPVSKYLLDFSTKLHS